MHSKLFFFSLRVNLSIHTYNYKVLLQEKYRTPVLGDPTRNQNVKELCTVSTVPTGNTQWGLLAHAHSVGADREAMRAQMILPIPKKSEKYRHIFTAFMARLRLESTLLLPTGRVRFLPLRSSTCGLGSPCDSIIGVRLRPRWWTVAKQRYSTVMQKLLQIISPRFFNVSANPANSKAHFQLLKPMQSRWKLHAEHSLQTQAFYPQN